MNIEEIFIKEFAEHFNYANSFVEAQSAFCTQFYHPKTGRKITYSEKCSLIQQDIEKRAKKIAKKIEENK